ncbi:substrate-binding domain-containing protein [Mesorhizobium sp. B4-1-3]|uniref:LacI family DNA-binding transcriptional regulator n=1 Tax=Mesorhizobium sp. B4-1-3 TaxID=2589889 RepID=UPI00112A623D|nr:LacI family DNA-binding transcriptional regulator [Mesorhizobium sp. B4-1-3]TPI12473.1 substrate-binding domain-containing protein [Mesorhizobium sp. B4-1-3]
MKRPTIQDLATAAGVSVATVNRILGGTVSVRPKTIQRVQSAAEEIGFYAIGAIDDRARKISPHYRLGFLLQQSTRDLYQLFGKKIVAACRERRDDVIDPVVDFVDILTPETISNRLIALGEECDAVAVVAADHPIVGQAIRALKEVGKPVVSYITDQSAPERAAYVGTDNWKLGRTAAFLMAQTTQGPGRIAVFIGNHRYQCQDVSDASFRSYLREHAPRLTVEESRPTHEEPSEAYRMVAELLKTAEDLVGILIVGGGITGVLRALKEVTPERRAAIKVVCRDIGPETRRGLSEGLITAALCHPLEATSALLVQTMIDVIHPQAQLATLQRSIPFEIVTPENI